MTPIDPDRLMVAFRIHAGVCDRVNVKKLARLLGRVHDYLVRVGLEAPKFAKLVAGDARLVALLADYLSRDKAPLRPPVSRSSGLRGSLDEVRRALADGFDPPDDHNGDLGDDPEGPTPARPGSTEKIAILADRFRRRVSLFHPKDARG